jgi:hypothetical protein
MIPDEVSQLGMKDTRKDLDAIDDAWTGAVEVG